MASRRTTTSLLPSLARHLQLQSTKPSLRLPILPRRAPGLRAFSASSPRTSFQIPKPNLENRSAPQSQPSTPKPQPPTASARPLTDAKDPAPRNPKQEPPHRTLSRLESNPHYQLTFTCIPCGERSAHKISKQGYHHGSVLITCPGCHNRHVISDHLLIFGDAKVTVEDLLREKGQLVKRGTLGEDGDIEFLPDDLGVATDAARGDGASGEVAALAEGDAAASGGPKDAAAKLAPGADAKES